jgi:hypothetical protein
MGTVETLKHDRSTVDKRVHINDRQPFTGRFLNDISVGGVSLVYLSEASPTRKPLETGQTIFLHFGDKAGVPCEFVRDMRAVSRRNSISLWAYESFIRYKLKNCSRVSKHHAP